MYCMQRRVMREGGAGQQVSGIISGTFTETAHKWGEEGWNISTDLW